MKEETRKKRRERRDGNGDCDAEMKIVMMNGGLGNQAFQYIFFRYIEETTKDVCALDNSFFCVPNPIHQGYELEKAFGVKPKLLSDSFSAEVWDEIVRKTRLDREAPLTELLRERMGADVSVLCEGTLYAEDTRDFVRPYTGNMYSIKVNTYVPAVQSQKGDVYYYGYWINMHWFQYIRDDIVRELAFSPAEDAYNRRMTDEISGCHSVSVHVRRGDFVTLGWALGADWYRQSVLNIKECVRDPVFYIFSDDLRWCEASLGEMGLDRERDRVVFADGNKGADSFRDMHLMSLCKNMIIANSSFSYLAALLNQNPNKFILNPTAREII
jgi:hypothetical protein